MSLDTIKSLSMIDVSKWYLNHKLDTIFPVKWKKVSGGCRVYIQRMTDRLIELGVSIQTQTPVTVVSMDKSTRKIKIGDMLFDAIVLACPGNIATKICTQMKENCSRELISALENISYQPTSKVVHTNTNLIGRKKSTWGVYNIQYDNQHNTLVDHMWYGGASMGTTDDSNTEDIDGVNFSYEHVVPDLCLVSSREVIRDQTGPVLFAGAYLFGDSFHEAAVDSAEHCAVRVLEYLDRPKPSGDSLLHTLKELHVEPVVDSMAMRILDFCVDTLTMFMYRLSII